MTAGNNRPILGTSSLLADMEDNMETKWERERAPRMQGLGDSALDAPTRTKPHSIGSIDSGTSNTSELASDMLEALKDLHSWR